MGVVRIHVVRLKHLLIGIAGVLALIALVFTLLGSLSGNQDNQRDAGGDYVFMEAEAVAVSASAVFAKPGENDMRAEVVKEPEKKIRVLIYHTHTHEAYKKRAEDDYIETSAWRTKDNDHNVVRVGQELQLLLEMRGFSVVHDTTDHELADLGTAYTRSLKTMEAYQDEVDVFIDLHRDAYHAAGSGNPFSLVCEEGDFARLMFLVGNGEGFSEKPFYKENYELAQLLTGAINERISGLCRPVMVKDGRYNQHLCEKSLLVEVGHNENSLQQALDAMPYLADALKEVLIDQAGTDGV